MENTDHPSPGTGEPRQAAPSPPIVTPPPLTPPRRERPPAPAGRGWKIAALVLLGLAALYCVGSVLEFLGGWSRRGMTVQRDRGPRIEEVVVEDSDAEDKIAVIDLEGEFYEGPWDGSGLGIVDLVRRQLKRAQGDSNVKAVILRVNSPGGEVLTADELYRAVDQFQRDSRKPVIASMGSLGASGGYYVACACRWIVAHELTVTGSIGVIMHGVNYRGLMDKVGLRPEVYKSGKFKDMMSGNRLQEEITREEREMLQAMVDSVFERFKTVIAEGRKTAAEKNKDSGRKLDGNWELAADGRVLTGRQAWERGFVDELGNFKTAVERAKRLANTTRVNLIQYRQQFDLGSFLRLLGKAQPTNVTLDLGVELPRLKAGRPYYLFRPGLH